MISAEEVLKRYRQLCDYSDQITSRVRENFADKWQCRSGCSGCCQLSSICGLEAVVLLKTGALPQPFDRQAAEGGRCCLLRENQCLIYEQRPLICRTHGLPVISGSLTQGEVDCCPLNLPALVGAEEIAIDLVLDLDQHTENLMRLNLAFFLILGNPELAESRFSLASLAQGKNIRAELRVAAGLSRRK